MIEIAKNLFVGSGLDYEMDVRKQEGWSIVHACKEPYHRQAVGYSYSGFSKDHPEYFVAYRDNELMLNLLDVFNPKLIEPIVIDAAIQFIDENLRKGKRVLLHCNAGVSRSASIGMLYLASVGRFRDMDFQAAQRVYRNIYPPYAPARGMYGYITKNWDKYNK